jgi:hypothetical protein
VSDAFRTIASPDTFYYQLEGERPAARPVAVPAAPLPPAPVRPRPPPPRGAAEPAPSLDEVLEHLRRERFP